MRVKIENRDEEPRFFEIVANIKPGDLAFEKAADLFTLGVLKFSLSKESVSCCVYDRGEGVEPYYPAVFVFCDKMHNETGVEDCEDWYWEPNFAGKTFEGCIDVDSFVGMFGHKYGSPASAVQTIPGDGKPFYIGSGGPGARLMELTRKDIGDFRVLGVLPCVTEGVRDYIAEWVVDGDCHIHVTVEEMRNSGCWNVRFFEYGRGYIPGVKHESVVKYRQEFVLFMASVLAKYKLKN